MATRPNKRGAYYWVGTKPFLSVTTALKVLDKPALMYWFGREVHNAMLKEPSLTWDEAKGRPYQKNKEAKSRGTTVHDIVEAWKNIDEVVGSESVYAGYAKAFKKFLSDHDVVITDSEKQVISDKYQYGGSLDILARVNNQKLPTLIDVKTGKDLYYEVDLQLSAYRQAVEEQGIEVEATGALLLNEDGTYKYQIGADKLDIFLACLEIYKDMHRSQLIKIGYIKE